MEEIKKDSKKETFMQGVMALIFSQVLIKILGLIYKIYLTNRENFGDAGNAIYNSGYQIYALLLTLSSIGIPNAISKLVSEKLANGDRAGAHRVFKIAFITFAILGLIGTCALFFGANFIAKVWLAQDNAELTLMALSPAIFFVSIASVIRGYYSGISKLKVSANSQTYEQLSKTILTVILVEIVAHFTASNTKLMAAGATVATSLATFFSFFYLYMCYKIEKKQDKKIIHVKENNKVKGETVISVLKKILAVSIPISITALLSSINKNVDSFTVVRFLTPTLGYDTATKLYGILGGKVDTLTSLPLSFNVAFATALVPALATAKVKNDTNTINRRISFSLMLTILIGLPCTIGMALFANEILLILFPATPEGGVLLAISAFTIIFTVLSQTINGALQGLGKVKIPAIALGCGVFAKILCNVFLIPTALGANAAALGSVICHIIAFTIGYIALRKTVKLNFSLIRLLVKPCIATGIMAIISYNLYKILLNVVSVRLSAIIAMVVAVIIYVILIIVLKVLSKEDMKSLPFGDKICRILEKLKIYK